MYYLVILFPLFVGALFLFSPKRKGLKILLNSIRLIASIVLVLVLLRLYWFDIYKIPSGSMEQTLHIRDKIIIRKNTLPELNEIVVFNSMNVDSLILVKRCVGLPGDTLSIYQNKVFCNGKALEEPPLLQWSFVGDSLNIAYMNTVIKRPIKGSGGHVLLTTDEAEKLNKERSYLNLKKDSKPYGERGKVYPRHKILTNNRDNFSCFIVPAKGLTLELDSVRALWYRKYIKIENPSARVDKTGLVTIDGASSRHYTFQDNYYYVMGDNRHRSFDSRFFGFISSSNIHGKVIYICSYNND